MSNVKSIIQNMSAETRAKAEAFASAKGTSLEEAVATQLSVELTERTLGAVSGGTAATFHGEKTSETIFGEREVEKPVIVVTTSGL
jgi:hypothetical protein